MCVVAVGACSLRKSKVSHLRIGVYCPCQTYADYVFHSVKVEKFVTVNSDRGHSHAACHHGNSLSFVISRVALNATHVVYQFCVGKEVFGNKFGTQRISRHKYGFCEIAFFCSNVRVGIGMLFFSFICS